MLETKCGGGGYLVFSNQVAKRREREIGRAMKKEREKQAVFL